MDYKRATIQEGQYIINLIHIQDRLEDHGLRPKSNSGIIELVLPSIMCYLGKKALSRRFNWKENFTLLWTLRWQQTRLLGQENFLFYFLKRNGSIRGAHFRFGSIFIKKNNQIELFFFKKNQNRTETGSNRPVLVQFGSVF
jgi:hypothetical protein